MSKRKSREIIAGSSPRVSLLPPEIAERAKDRTTYRLLGLFVVFVLLATGGAVFLTTTLAASAQTGLEQAQAQTQALLKEQGKYAEVSNLETLKAAIEGARTYGASTEVDWFTTLEAIEAKLPEGTTVESALGTVSAPWDVQLAPIGPLRGERAATVVMEMFSVELLRTTQWVDAFEELPGFVDVSVDSWSYKPEQLGYVSVITLNLGSDARSGRFAIEEVAADEPTEESGD